MPMGRKEKAEKGEDMKSKKRKRDKERERR